MCASLSHQWSHRAISILWGKYAGYLQLKELVLSPWKYSTRPKDNEVEVMTPKQLRRCEYYCQYIKSLKFGQGVGTESILSDWLGLLETFMQMDKSASLFPRLEAISIPPEFIAIRGSYLLLDRVASPKTRTLRLAFPKVPSSALLSQYFAILPQKLLNLTDLSISSIANLDEEQHLAMSDPFQPESLAAFALMTNLRSLSLDWILISFDPLDVVGDFPCLTTLKIRVAVSLTNSNIYAYHNHHPRGSKFKSLEHFHLMAPFSTAKVLFVTYFSQPPYSLREMKMDLLHDNLAGRDSLTFLEGVAKPLRELELFVGSSHETASIGSLEGCTVCKQLTSLKITHSLFLSFQYPETLLLQRWQDLTVLHLLKSEYSNVLIPDTLFDIVPYYIPFQEPDVYTLGFLADFMHNLTELQISLLACEISSCDYNSPFQSLKELHFGSGSFVNFKTSGFSQGKAAEYIASLLPPDSTIKEGVTDYTIGFTEDGEEENGGPGLDDLVYSHSTFMTNFTQHIRYHMSLRKDQSGIQEGKDTLMSQ